MSPSNNPGIRGVFTIAVTLMAMVAPLALATAVVPGAGTPLDPTVEEVLAKVDFNKLAIAPAGKSSRISGDVVVPGPGMPSLESLGLTSENFLDPDFMENYSANQTESEDTTGKRSLSGLQKCFPNGCLGVKVGFGTYPGFSAATATSMHWELETASPRTVAPPCVTNNKATVWSPISQGWPSAGRPPPAGVGT